MRQLFVLFLIVVVVGCQNNIKTHQLPPVVVDSLKAHLLVLTADSLEGREAGTIGGEKAARYLAKYLSKAGVRPIKQNPEGRLSAYFQEFSILESTDREVSARLVIRDDSQKSYRLKQNHDFYCFWEALPKARLVGEVEFAGFGIEAPEYGYADIPTDSVAGKIALVFHGEPDVPGSEEFFWGKHRTNYSDMAIKARILAAKGFRAVFVIPFPGKEASLQKMLERRLQSPNRKRAFLAENDTIPVLYFTEENSQKLFGVDSTHFAAEQKRLAEWVSGNREKPFVWRWPDSMKRRVAEIEFDKPKYTKLTCRNVLGILPGRDKSLSGEAILVGSHYDHEGIVDGKIYRGADDNASGVVANMNIARILNGLPVSETPKRTIIFAFWDAEEKGMLGSRYFLESPLFRQWRIRTVFNMDMIGRDASFNFAALRKPVVDENAANKVMMFYSAQAPEMAVIGKALNQWTQLKLLMDPNVYFTSGSDHAQFHFRRIPVAFYFTGFHMDYSSPADVPEKINFEKLAKITHHILLFVDYLGSADRVPGFNPEILVAPEGDFKM